VSNINALAAAVDGNELQVDVVSSALPTGAATEATLLGIETNSAPGTKVDAATMPAGGVGRIGWLSAIWLHTLDIASKLPSLISGRVPVQITAASATAFASQSDVAAVEAALQPLATETTLVSIDTAISQIDAATAALAGTVAGTELQVDIVGQLPVGNNRIGKIVLTDGTTDISARDLTSANPLDVAIVDGDGNQISSFGGGTQYTEGDADATITGTAILWEKAGDVLSPVSAVNPLPVTGSLSVTNTVALAVFRALATGTGYSAGNIIVLRQTPPTAPEYYNATTNAVIAAPAPADLGPIASSSNVVVDNFPAGFQVSNFPVSQAVTGTVNVGNLPATQTVAGSVGVTNFPAAFQVSNFPTTQTIAGTVTANAGTNLNTSLLALEGGNLAAISTALAGTIDIAGAVTVENFPASFQVSNFPTTQAVSGSVSVSNHPTAFQISNFPATQPVSGNIGVTNFPTAFQVSNFPTTQAVSGTITANAGTNLNTSALALESGGNLAAIATALAGTVDIAGAVSVSNFPGSFDVSNFPATQAVSGTITANAGTNLNTSALALESGGNLATISANTAPGTKITAATIPAGGSGPIGWLSAIWADVVGIAGKLPALSGGKIPVEVTGATVTGTVAVSNQPTSIQVSNFPGTQPVSGTVTANAGTNLNTSLLALESGGNLATIATNTAQGAAITGATMPTGGTGPIGWLSATWVQATALLASVGAPADAAATSDSGTFSLIAQFKRFSLRFGNLYKRFCDGRSTGNTGNNAVVTFTIAAPGPGKRWLITGVLFSYSGAIAANAAFEIVAAGQFIAGGFITQSGPGPIALDVLAPVNTAVSCSLAASGTVGSTGSLYVYYCEQDVI
jgi:hypothetical protein